MCNYAGTCKGICSQNLVYNFLIQLLPLQSSVFVVHFPNTFSQRNKAFTKGSSQNEIVPLLVIFHLPYSKYRGVKIVFTRVVIEIKIFHSRRLCSTCVALMQLVCGNRVCCCKLDQSYVLRNCRKISRSDIQNKFVDFGHISSQLTCLTKFYTRDRMSAI